jgi:small GTP-binding protein
MRILNPEQEKILTEERQVLNQLNTSLVEFGISADDKKTLAESILQLDDLFLLVVVGEFNAGKSAFINALLGHKLLQEGVTPTTAQINILRYGSDQDRKVLNEYQHVLNLPNEMLAEISIVDTPGTNAIIRSHEAITSQFVPRSDLVLFITSVDRPFTESERSFLEKIRDWGKKVVIVVNKIDILENAGELDQILKFVRENAISLLSTEPEIFPVSARLALRAKQVEESLWEDSRFEPLENYIRTTLDERSRVRLKFLNPLGVGLHLADGYLNVVEERLALLEDDFKMLTDVDSQLEIYRNDMQRDFEFRMSDIEKILFEMEQRGDEYFDETFRLARVMDLLSKDRITREFEEKVVTDVPERIDHKVGEMIDWLVESDLRQWQAVNEHLAERRRTHKERIVGETQKSSFHFDRERLFDAVGRESQRVVDGYDKTAEAEAIARGAQEAVAASAAMGIGAVGLGALITILATTMAADVTGVLLASLIAALGIFIIPARRKTAKKDMHQKVADLREQLSAILRTQFEEEIERSLQRINAAISPYTRFVRAERQKLLNAQEEIEQVKTNLIHLRSKIDEI